MQQETTPNTEASNNNDVLFQHAVKPEWGVALMAWERDGKRGYQFEDGKLRVIKNGYYHFLREIDRPADETERALADLNLKLGRRRASRRLSTDRMMIPLTEQISYFRDLFPKGFRGVKFAKKHRGIDAKKRLKRHRNPSIADATRLADREALAARVAGGEALAIVGEIAELLDATDMVTKSQLKGIHRISAPLAEQLVLALIDLVWGDSALDKRFNRWVGALKRAFGKKARWQLATAIPALMKPSEHVCVKRTTFVKQAAWMAPSLQIPTAPSGRVYVRLVEMAKLMATKLFELDGLKVRDNIDLYDFINATLRPKAVKEIEASMKSADSSSVETDDAETAAA